MLVCVWFIGPVYLCAWVFFSTVLPLQFIYVKLRNFIFRKRDLGPVYIEVGGPQVGEVTCLDGGNPPVDIIFYFN